MDYNAFIKRFQEAVTPLNYEASVFSIASVYIIEYLTDINWAGFYKVYEDTLLLTQYIGKPACEKIAFGRGVCGTCARDEKTQRVADVHQFSGHIACDSDSQSEIVIPIYKNGKLYAVLDIDSPVLNRFDETDQAGLEAFAKVVEKAIEFAVVY